MVIDIIWPLDPIFVQSLTPPKVKAEAEAEAEAKHNNPKISSERIVLFNITVIKNGYQFLSKTKV